jgi:hypothetical protein
MKKNMKIFGRCILFVFTVMNRLHTKKISNSLSEFFPMSKSYILLTLQLQYMYIVLLLLTLKVYPLKEEKAHAHKQQTQTGCIHTGMPVFKL